ncbi:MAG: hydroxyethylthiazole kinase [Deltaproteobacteria bacterium]|nr:hydroxyethylthiazole kinase [Deltaproteobacteria bacterium]MBM4322208.1 hydroxyethylthiazole kinase [Deltaproteobacteria bacterium]
MIFQAERLLQVPLTVRKQKPVVHAITNWVTANDVASALQAIGARPIMATAPEEVEEITSRTDALVLNLGTPSPVRIEAMLLAGLQANKDGHPVLFDPVGAAASKFRIESCKRILSILRLTVIRGNQAEIGTLAGQESHLAGVDSVTGPEDLNQASQHLSKMTGAVVVASGPQDLIVSSEKRVIVENGHPMMGKVLGMGCMLTAVLGAFNAVEKDPVMATVSAIAFFGLAGEQAALLAKGPGTFKSAFLDSLFSLTPDQMRKGIRIKS